MANGKGDLRRPGVIPEHELSARWFATFGNTRCPLNPNVARSEIEAASGSKAAEWFDAAGRPKAEYTPPEHVCLDRNCALPGVHQVHGTADQVKQQPVVWVLEDGTCYECHEMADISTQCHRGSWQKNPGPRRK